MLSFHVFEFRKARQGKNGKRYTQAFASNAIWGHFDFYDRALSLLLKNKIEVLE